MYCCENAEAKIAERIKLYEQCISEVLKEQLRDRITEDELAYIELLIYHKYCMSLEHDIYTIHSPQNSTTT
jgi:hypothetical protein